MRGKLATSFDRRTTQTRRSRFRNLDVTASFPLTKTAGAGVTSLSSGWRHPAAMSGTADGPRLTSCQPLRTLQSMLCIARRANGAHPQGESIPPLKQEAGLLFLPRMRGGSAALEAWGRVEKTSAAEFFR